MNKKTLSEFFDSAAKKHIPDHVDMAPQIMERIQKRKGFAMNPKLKIFITALAVVLTCSLVLTAGPSVAYALQQLLGYIPNVGTVDAAASLRVLAGPTTQTNGGVSITVQNGTVDSQRTILSVSISGLTTTAIDPCSVDEVSDAQLRLSDGSRISLSEWAGAGPTRYDLRYYFPALPEGVTSATLEISCLLYQSAPVGWEIPLNFEPASNLQPFPVIAIDSARTPAQSVYGVSIALEQVVPLNDGYILMGSLTWGEGQQPNIGIMDVSPATWFQVLDGEGRELDVEWLAPDHPDAESQLHQKNSWSFKLAGKDHRWPLTIKMDQIAVSRNDQPYPDFTLDIGSTPQVGQVFVLDQELKHRSQPEYTLHLNTATLTDQNGILFDVSVPDAVTNLMIEYQTSELGVGFFYEKLAPGHLGVGFKPQGGWVSGAQRLTVSSLTFVVPGSWQISWQP